MRQDFEEFKKMNDMISRAQLANTAAEMVKTQADASSIQSELAKFSDSASAFAQVSLVSEAAIAMEKNLSITNQLESELAKLTGKSSAVEQYLSEEKMLLEQFNQFKSASQIGSESAKSLLQDYESATKSIDLNAIAAYREESSKDIYHAPRIETQNFQMPNFQLQKNPILETNKRLEKLESIAHKTEKNLKKINDTADDFSNNYSSNLSENKIISSRTIFIGIFSLIFTIVGSGLTYISIQDSRDSNLKTAKEKVVSEKKSNLKK